MTTRVAGVAPSSSRDSSRRYPSRRAALFGRLQGRGQVWMTATESALFDGIAAAKRFHVEAGTIAIA